MHVIPTTRAPNTAQLGYNGQLHEPTRAWQALGNGYRIYNPVIMRFHRPDDWSPFARGGANAYTYCGGEPISRSDQSGHFYVKMIPLAAFFASSAATLGFAGIAASTPNESQRALAIGASVVAFAGALTAGRYVWIKRNSRPQATTAPSTPTESVPPSNQLTLARPPSSSPEYGGGSSTALLSSAPRGALGAGAAPGTSRPPRPGWMLDSSPDYVPSAPPQSHVFVKHANQQRRLSATAKRIGGYRRKGSAVALSRPRVAPPSPPTGRALPLSAGELSSGTGPISVRLARTIRSGND